VSDALEGLTRVPDKARLYAGETWFREAWELLGAELADPAALAERHAILMIKPDAIAARAAADVLDSAAASGFAPVAVRPVALGRHTLRALWLFKFNIATVARMRITDLIHEQSPNLLVLLRDMRPEPGLPASLRLTGWKGPSDPERRRPDQLRSRITIQNRLLSHVHTSDEPADVVRELGLLLDPGDLGSFVREALAAEDARAAVDELTGRLYGSVPAHDLRLETALPGVARVAERLAEEAPAGVERAVWDEVARAAESVAGAWGAGWDALAPIASPEAVGEFAAWDVITVGSYLVPQDIPGGERTLGDVAPELWGDRSGVSQTS
jgi:hypothetical protein